MGEASGREREEPAQASEPRPPGPPPGLGPRPTDEGESAAAGQATTPEEVQKLLRNLKKKIRQAEGIAQKQADGKELELLEVEKLSKLEGW